MPDSNVCMLQAGGRCTLCDEPCLKPSGFFTRSIAPWNCETPLFETSRASSSVRRDKSLKHWGVTEMTATPYSVYI